MTLRQTAINLTGPHGAPTGQPWIGDVIVYEVAYLHQRPWPERLPSQRPFGRGHAAHALTASAGCVQSPAKRFEDGLYAVVIVGAAQQVDV